MNADLLICSVCNDTIKVMCFKGTGKCSENHRKQAERDK